MTDELQHVGTPRHSGRYPWGSGENPQHSRDFLGYVNDLRKKGLTEKEIAQGLGLKSTTQLRSKVTIARNEKTKDDQAQIQKLKAKGMSNVAIGTQMGIGESQVRALSETARRDRASIIDTTSAILRDNVAKKTYIDVGEGTEQWIGVSREKLNACLSKLKEEGYNVYTINDPQLSSQHETKLRVLAPPDKTWADLARNKDQINTINDYSEDGGRTFLGIEKPKSVSSSRVAIRYGDQGGAEMDGVIHLRPGKQDISLGAKRYAQVRIAVDDTHYMKGMALYSDNLPDGVDLLFHTTKKDTGNKLDALKKFEDDPDNPFGSMIRQRHYDGPNGEKLLSAINVVGKKEGAGEEGAWNNWSRSLSSQVLSKQPVTLAKRQLGFAFDAKQAEFDEIMKYTNPTVRAKLLETFSSSCDSSAGHLKAAALPRQRSQVILPIQSLKDNEVYAPNFRPGERVVLIRHPHGGTFEIPELTVNNNNREAKRVLGNAEDAIGINSKVAHRLSGADFDGDAVIVIPNGHRAITTSPALKDLKDFDPIARYQDKSLPELKDATKQREMGKISNLITDMTIKGAHETEIARAVKHSMVVIDAAKHSLDYKRSAEDQNIAQLKKKYQQPTKGAATLISRARSEARVPDRKLRPVSEGGAIDPKTGKLVYVETGAAYTNKKGKSVDITTKTTKMDTVDDAFELSSGTTMETIYATHANKLKALANQARLETLKIRHDPISVSAKQTYKAEVATLNAKLNVAEKNKPLERRANILGNAVVRAKKRENPYMDRETLQKIKRQALLEQRTRAGAGREVIKITDKEWAAIQAGAVPHSKLKRILDNADLERIKELATPRTKPTIPMATVSRARLMMNAGYTQAEVADHLGIALSTLTSALSG